MKLKTRISLQVVGTGLDRHRSGHPWKRCGYPLCMRQAHGYAAAQHKPVSSAFSAPSDTTQSCIARLAGTTIEARHRCNFHSRFSVERRLVAAASRLWFRGNDGRLADTGRNAVLPILHLYPGWYADLLILLDRRIKTHYGHSSLETRANRSSRLRPT